MKRTALYKNHIKAGGKMVEFAGFEMPVEYSGIRDEHLTVRQKSGVFDVSHMGEIWVKGTNALSLLNKISSNDPEILLPGKAQYSCMPNGRGGIVDDLLIYCFNKYEYLLVVNAANIQKDWKWIVSQNTMDAELDNTSDFISQLAVQGPDSLKILQKLTNIELADIPYYSFVTGEFAGFNKVIISATGYTGSGGFELYMFNEQAEQIWDAIFEMGKKYGIKPAGLGARDTLRLEMGYCLYGNDINDNTSPIEAGLGWITKFNDGRDFVDREFLEVQKNEGTQRKLRGFKMLDRAIPRHGYEIYNDINEKIGDVTSGTMSPVLNEGIGMGYIDNNFTRIGSVVFIRIRNKFVPAEIVKLPFIS